MLGGEGETVAAGGHLQDVRGVGVEEGSEGGLAQLGLVHDVAVGELGGRRVGVVHLAADDADPVAAFDEELVLAGLVELEDADDARSDALELAGVLALTGEVVGGRPGGVVELGNDGVGAGISSHKSQGRVIRSSCARPILSK